MNSDEIISSNLLTDKHCAFLMYLILKLYTMHNKKNLPGLLLFILLVTINTGCLKDKGFNNNEYGINDPDNSPNGIGFVQGIKFINPITLKLSSDAQTISAPLTLSILGNHPHDHDIKVQLAIDTSIIGNYNRDNAGLANFTALEILDPSLLSLQNEIITIAPGSQTANVVLNISSTLNLNPALKYGIALRIVNNDAGYPISSNRDEILLQSVILNAYDGVYQLHGQFYHPTLANSFPTFTFNVELWTTGPNSVIMYSPYYLDFLHPLSVTTNGSITAFGDQSPEYTINPSTHEVSVQNVYAGAVTFYTMGAGYDNNGYDSHWDSVNHKIYACFGYNINNSIFNPTQSREWIDTLIYTGPR